MDNQSIDDLIKNECFLLLREMHKRCIQVPRIEDKKEGKVHDGDSEPESETKGRNEQREDINVDNASETEKLNDQQMNETHMEDPTKRDDTSDLLNDNAESRSLIDEDTNGKIREQYQSHIIKEKKSGHQSYEYSQIPSSDVDIRYERGTKQQTKLSMNKGDLEIIIDLGRQLQLEEFSHQDPIFPEEIMKYHQVFIPKERTLIVHKSGARLACLFESLAEWAQVNNNEIVIAPLSDIYQQLFRDSGGRYVNRKLMHSPSSTFSIPLRDIITKEILNNVEALFTCYNREMLGSNFQSVEQLRNGMMVFIEKDEAGGLPHLCMFSVMCQTPIIIWEHEDNSSLSLSTIVMPAPTEDMNRLTTIIANPHNSIIHLLFNRRDTQMGHYEVLVVFNL